MSLSANMPYILSHLSLTQQTAMTMGASTKPAIAALTNICTISFLTPFETWISYEKSIRVHTPIVNSYFQFNFIMSRRFRQPFFFMYQHIPVRIPPRNTRKTNGGALEAPGNSPIMTLSKDTVAFLSETLI